MTLACSVIAKNLSGAFFLRRGMVREHSAAPSKQCMPWLLLQALSALLLLRTGTRVQAKEVCTFGNAACCTIFKNEEEKSLLDFDLLKDGLVKKLIGHEDPACMSFDLIGQINILGTLDIFPKVRMLAEHSKVLLLRLMRSLTATRPPPAAVVTR